MSDPIAATVTATRDMDELEGTLLPVATQVVECDSNNKESMMAEASIPATEFFDYDAAIAKEEQQEQEQQEIEAIPIPDNGGMKHNYSGVSDDSRTAISSAERNGIQRSEEELEAIRRNKQRIFPHNYHEHNTMKAANEYALHRDREGLQVKDDHIDSDFILPKKTEEEEEIQNQKQNQKPKVSGYQVREYDTGSYDTKSYDVNEYKSVYD
jgi:hypothetical protein